MANEFIARKGIISLDSIQVTGSITATGGITISGSISSASFATTAATASSADNFFVRQNLTASSALFTGSITAQTLVVQTVTSSITYSSGSNIFGNLPSNVQQFTGSLRVTGSGNHFIQGGNVGIGNSTPANLLTIDGVSTCAKISIETDTVSANTVIGYLDFTNNNAGTTYGRVLGGRNSAGDGYVALGTGVSNNLYALESGYVGIGTSSPSTALHISSSTTQITLQNNAGGTNARRIGMNMTSGDTFKILSLCDNNTTRVDNIIVANVLSGNVGIGTASPNRLLDVSTGSDTYVRVTGNRGNADGVHIGNIEFYNSFSSILAGEVRGITGTGGTQSNSGQLAFYTNNAGTYAERMRITSAGIACFSGTVCAPCFATISDYRMKSNLRPIEGLSIIMNTKPYKFEYNYDCSTSFGMIAHELQDTLPEAVFGVKDGEVMQGVDYMKLLPIAIKAIQEQQCQICSQATIIHQLKTCLGII